MHVKNPIIPSIVRVMSDNFPDLSLDSIKGCSSDQGNKFRSVRPITFNPFIISTNGTGISLTDCDVLWLAGSH